MNTVVVVLEGLVVLGAIFLGVRMGGIGLGLWGVAGTAVLVFGFQLDPGSPPVDAFFIIIAVITASSAMQAAGGIDWLVVIASRIIQPTRAASPRRSAGLVRLHGRRWHVEHLLRAHSGHPRNRVPNGHPPEKRARLVHRHLRARDHSQPGLGGDGGLPDAAARGLRASPEILKITIPAAIVSCIVTSLVQQRIGKELWDDPEYFRRVEAGEVEVPEKIMLRLPPRQPRSGHRCSDVSARQPGHGQECRLHRGSPGCSDDGDGPASPPVPPGGRRSALIFLAGVAIIVLIGLFAGLRPTVGTGEDAAPLSMTIVIELVMFTVALDHPARRPRRAGSRWSSSHCCRAGIVAAIALFGIAWMTDTYIAANPETIIEPLGRDRDGAIRCSSRSRCSSCAALTTSQSATTNTLVPIALAAGLAPGIVTAMWPSLVGVWLFPANGTQIAAVEIDQTGSTQAEPGAGLALVHDPDARVVGRRRRGGPG